MPFINDLNYYFNDLNFNDNDYDVLCYVLGCYFFPDEKLEFCTVLGWYLLNVLDED